VFKLLAKNRKSHSKLNILLLLAHKAYDRTLCGYSIIKKEEMKNWGETFFEIAKNLNEFF